MDNNKLSKWIIVSDECETHYINKLVTWKDALSEHIKWCRSSNNIEKYAKALSAFDDFKEAIEFYGIMFEDKKIVAMLPVTDDCYIDNEYI